mmetsp:Transcript_10844/g.8060  ORF Transcript_10844/g.8060 Transcript_10844/m.8060 type:complete len:98 (-) Transcript_10844:262-555(-)
MESSKVSVKVKSFDGHEMKLEQGPLFLNQFFADMLEGDEMPSEALEMTNELLTKDVIDQVMKYCEFAHKNLPPKIHKPFKQTSIYDITSPWYANYAN